jgi:predicted AlkP superfamily phosphohydrolase/phosphomutase
MAGQAPGLRRALALVAAALLLTCSRCEPTEKPPAKALASAAPTVNEDIAARTPRPAGGRAPVIWIGLDGVDFELVDRLVAEGRMPFWKRLEAEGYTARLRAFPPVLSPVIWTTLATGVGPDVHRVLDFQEVDPSTGQKVPISGRSRAVPAIWNVASSAGRSVGVVGWWATHSAEEVSGFFVSDHASPILFEGLPRAGVTYPAGLAAGIDQILAREGVVADAELSRWLDVSAEEIARSRGAGLSNPIDALSRIVGATRVEQRIARDLYDKHLPDLMMAYFEGTDVIGHIFGRFAPPKMECVSDEDFRRYHRAVDEYYALVDAMLGQWMRRAEEDGATLLINSDHGFKWGSERPCERLTLSASMSGNLHRLDGVFVAWGARVRKSPERETASVFDVAPTVAALLDLPVDRRLPGKVLRAAFPQVSIPARQDLFGTVAVRRVQAENMTEKQSSEYAQRLKSLGYLSGSAPSSLAPTGGERPGLTEVGWNNLGVYQRDNTKALAAAEAAFQKAVALSPQYPTPQYNLAVLYRMRGEDRKAVDWLFRSLQAGHNDPESTILIWYVEYADHGKAAVARDLLERGALRHPESEAIARELGLVRFRSKDCPGAWQAVAGLEDKTTASDTLNTLAMIKTCLGQRDAAIALFEKSLSINAQQPAVLRSLSILQKPPAAR